MSEMIVIDPFNWHDKVGAIKAVRSCTLMGLKEAKEFVENNKGQRVALEMNCKEQYRLQALEALRAQGNEIRPADKMALLSKLSEVLTTAEAMGFDSLRDGIMTLIENEIAGVDNSDEE